MKTLAGAMLVALILLQPADDESPRHAGLEGSKHDFSDAAWSGGDLCVACHGRAHEEPPAEAPLWNPSADFNRTFADALQDREDSHSLPGPGSLVCMRCHDGTMAGDMFGGLTAPRAANTRHPALFTTGHGGSNHPVGVEYPELDRFFWPVNAVLSQGKIPLPNGRVECVSCHDPHNELGNPYMLVQSNRRSALCLTCHRK